VSGIWGEGQVNGRLVIFPNQVNGGTAIASAKIRGYMVSVSGIDLKQSTVVLFCQRLIFSGT